MTDSTTTTERDEWQDWRRRREEGLRAPYGWLSQTGLYWLQALGGFKATVPGIGGEWALRDGSVVFTPSDADGDGTEPVLVDARGGRTPIRGAVHVPSDAEENGAYVECGGIHAAVIERSGQFGIRVRDPESEFRRDFKGIEAYPFDPSWRIDGRFEPYGEARDTVVRTRVEGLTNTLEAIGVVHFAVEGAEQSLIAFDGGPADDGGRDLFIIFRDPTNGDTTYGSGRFLGATVPAGGSDVLLDFNRAFNPPCAFSPYCTCPLAPAGNEVSMPVTAGERH